VARITRKELKSDKFAQDVGLTVDFFEEHRDKFVRYGGIAAVLIVLIGGYMLYARHQHAARQEALYQALQAAEAPVGQAEQPGGLTFPTQQAKDQESVKRFTELAGKYSGSEEGEIAQYFLGSILADQGKLAEAEKDLLEAAQKGDAQYSSLAKLSLAQIYFEDGRSSQGEQTLRDLIAHPTVFVSSDQATIVLARQLSAKNPAEARKLLQPLLSKPGGVGQAASDANSSLPQ
jgi:predicted negative regulator of RcsB-dependent stress response